MNVALAANGRGVSQDPGHSLVDGDNISLRLALGGEFFGLLECLRRKHGSCPGAEILCCKNLASALTQVVVDVGRRHGRAPPALVEILKKFVAGQIATRFDDSG